MGTFEKGGHDQVLACLLAEFEGFVAVFTVYVSLSAFY